MDCGRKSRQTEGMREGGRRIFTNEMRNQTKGWREQTVGEGEDKQMGCEWRREQTGGVAGEQQEGETKDKETSLKEEYGQQGSRENKWKEINL